MAAGVTQQEPEESPWPVGKLRTKLAELAESVAPQSRGHAVVLTTGSMNPVHRGHVELLHQAARRVEKAGFAVVGAWISPSHDDYVQPKARSLGTIGLSDAFRVEVARRAVAADSMVDVGTWEARQLGGWPDFPEVCDALQQHLSALPEGPRLRGEGAWVRVFYACGTDHAKKCGLYHGLRPDRGIGVVVVPRQGGVLEAENVDKFVYVAEAAAGGIAAASSTKVRAAVAIGDQDYLRQVLSAEALQFLVSPTPEEHSQFGKDFASLGVTLPEAESRRRSVYISLSSIMRLWDRHGEACLSQIPRDALFFFGSKRSWVFPNSDAELKESRKENDKYTRPAYDKLRALIQEKEARGEVFFLKPPGFKYNGGLYHGDPDAFGRASTWLQGHDDPATGKKYSPLLLDPSWWRDTCDRSSAKHSRDVETIIKNFTNGAHDYPPVMELLYQSNPTLDIVLQ